MFKLLLNYQGAIGIIGRVRYQIGNFVSFKNEKYFIFEQMSKHRSFKPPKIEVKAEIVQKDDFLNYAKAFKKMLGRTADERFNAGHLCFGAFVNGDYVHLKWVSLKDFYVGEVDSTIRLGSDSAYIFDGYTLSDYRGLGISSAVMEKTLLHLLKLGIEKVYSIVRYNNFPSIRLKQKENSQKIGVITYRKVFFKKFHTYKGETEVEQRKMDKLFLKKKTG